MPTRYRRESEVSCCLKYVIFSVNYFFWMMGLCVLAIGVWAWTEKDIFNNLNTLKNVTLDPAFILICVGCITFLIGITGCVGALRENTVLLALYTLFLLTLLIVEMCCGCALVILKDKGWIKDQATDGLRAFITHYREDPDQQNLIDWIQEDWLHCCGIEGPKDWDSNNYFNCSSTTVGSREACGVPFSCCKRRPQEIIKNKQCGYDVRKDESPTAHERQIYERGCLRAGEDWLESHLLMVAATTCSVMIIQVTGLASSFLFRCKTFDISKVIHEKGCVQAGEEWMEDNLISLSTCAIFLVFSQILGICFASNLRADILAQKAKWH